MLLDFLEILFIECIFWLGEIVSKIRCWEEVCIVLSCFNNRIFTVHSVDSSDAVVILLHHRSCSRSGRQGQERQGEERNEGEKGKREKGIEGEEKGKREKGQG